MSVELVREAVVRAARIEGSSWQAAVRRQARLELAVLAGVALRANEDATINRLREACGAVGALTSIASLSGCDLALLLDLQAARTWAREALDLVIRERSRYRAQRLATDTAARADAAKRARRGAAGKKARK